VKGKASFLFFSSISLIVPSPSSAFLDPNRLPRILPLLQDVNQKQYKQDVGPWLQTPRRGPKASAGSIKQLLVNEPVPDE